MSDAESGFREWRFYVEDMLEFCDKVLIYTAGLDKHTFLIRTADLRCDVAQPRAHRGSSHPCPQRSEKCTFGYSVACDHRNAQPAGPRISAHQRRCGLVHHSGCDSESGVIAAEPAGHDRRGSCVDGKAIPEARRDPPSTERLHARTSPPRSTSPFWRREIGARSKSPTNAATVISSRNSSGVARTSRTGRTWWCRRRSSSFRRRCVPRRCSSTCCGTARPPRRRESPESPAFRSTSSPTSSVTRR